jgi:hypothetical protein
MIASKQKYLYEKAINSCSSIDFTGSIYRLLKKYHALPGSQRQSKMWQHIEISGLVVKIISR